MADEIEVTMGVTRNLGNFESMRYDAVARKTVEDVHDPEEWAALWLEVDQQIETKLLELAGVKRPS